MSVLLADGAGGPAVRVHARHDATAGDLLAAWPAEGLAPGGPLVVDGVAHAPSTALVDCGLAHGAVVGAGAADPERLTVVGGPLPPVTVPLTDPLLIGRAPGCGMVLDHPSVAPAHAIVEGDADGRRVTPLAGEVRLDAEPVAGPHPLEAGVLLSVGAIDLALVPAVPITTVPPPSAPVHRAPARVGDPTGPDPGAGPVGDAAGDVPPRAPTAPEPPGVLGLALPAAVGIALGVLVHPAAAAFAVFGPVVAIGSHLDARRRYRKDRRASEAAVRAASEATLAGRLRVDAERARAGRQAHPTAAGALAGARSARGLWTAPAATALVGWADDDARAPVTIDLAAGEVLGLCGPREWADAVRRAVVLDAVTRLGPRDLHLAIGPDPEEPWEWLPHRAGRGPSLTLTGPEATLEVAADPNGLSERCTLVLAWAPAGAVLDRHGGRGPVEPVRAHVADAGLTLQVARALARWTDPDRGGGLPDRVDLHTLLPSRPTPAPDGRRHLAATLGRAAQGPMAVDLVADGPHALVAGTTGAGKSELLRAWVVALAAGHPPSAVTFVLVDYKGGSAFDACARLPHTVGVVTDLDDGLGDRLLVALRAEVRRREEGLRAAGLGDLAQWVGGPPRLVVVVDEFATMAAEVPEVLASLVDLARRGRSLGVHLVLATQRPAGVVTDDIRANTALRICLRTIDAADAQDVVGSPGPADLPADRPGRAWVRHAAGSTLIQAAVAGAGTTGDRLVVAHRVTDPAPTGPAPPSGLDALVDGVAQRWATTPTPTALWLPPLPEVLAPPDLDAPGDGAVTLGRIDRPEDRSQPPLTWDPAVGPLIVLGGRGREPEQGLLTAVLGLAAARSPSDLHVHVVADRLPDALADLPHVGAFVERDDRISVGRLLARLAAGRSTTPTLLVVEGVDRLATGVDDLPGLRLVDALGRLVREAPGLGVGLAVSAAGPARLPPGLAGVGATVVALALDDPADHALLGRRPLPGDPPPGRGTTTGGHLVQLAVHADPSGAVRAIARRSAGPTAPRFGPLPDDVALADLPEGPGVVVGLRDRDLLAAGTTWRPGTPFVVSGPPRSGRSGALDLLARQAPVRATVHHRPGDDPAALRSAVRTWLGAPAPAAFLIDGAEDLDDPDGDLRALVTCRHPDLHLAVAVRADAWRAAYGSWLDALRPATHGLALAADPVRDADAWAVSLPGGTGGALPGRAVLVDGDRAELVQVARC